MNLCLASKATQKKQSKHKCLLARLAHSFHQCCSSPIVSEVIQAAITSMQLFPIRYTDKKQELHS